METGLARTEHTPKEYRAELSRCIALMLEGLNTYGKKASGSLLDAWFMSCMQSQVPFEALEIATGWYMGPNADTDDFPAAPKFARKALDLYDRRKIDVMLEDTKRSLKEFEAVAALDRRQRNIDAGLDLDALLPIEKATKLMGGVSTRMLPASAERTEEITT